ncbi:hypothetical protein [Halolamina litorea]|uniref:Uncharacterized protein n=1 Tax=Halolamina litorea TaxID=1515593 RepID=A0ABD6BTZ0_9EURY|nr:hypothetical protein [Halolamina litorea]
MDCREGEESTSSTITCRCGETHEVSSSVATVRCDCGARYAVTITELITSEFS